MAVQPSEITNISGWRLNKSEQKELDERVQKGEDKALVRKELQTKKAVACEERKRAAQAISAKPGSTGPRQKVSRKSAASSLPAAQSATAAATSGKDPTNAAYYASVEADIQTILQEFPGIELEMPLPLSQPESDRSKTGVQEPFNLTKAQNALGVHGVFRCSMSLFWVQILASPTPGVPMSRRRVLDMAEFYYPNGKPAFRADPRITAPRHPGDGVGHQGDDKGSQVANADQAANQDSWKGHAKSWKSDGKPSEPHHGDDKHSKSDCTVCGRSVGGGVAGAWQHRRSPYHLAAWVYWSNNETLPWKQCMEEGHKWSKQLGKTNEAGPEDHMLKNQKHKPSAPVPVRCDPERQRRDKDGSDRDPGSGGAGSSDHLLLQMWAATVRELK